ncbi:MAG: M28 family peptidase [Candidatus Kariarchaeaceae archaeon]
MLNLPKKKLILAMQLFLLLNLTMSQTEGEQKKLFELQQTEWSFNETSAWELLLAQEEIGFRYPGTAEHLETQVFIEDYFIGLDEWTFSKQTFEYNGVNLSNLIVEMEGSNTTNWIVFGAHYDTRAKADHDLIDPSAPVMGANDGASGVAVLMELARVIADKLLNSSLRLIFIDGEDQGSGGMLGWDWIVGSTYYVDSLSQSEKDEIECFILLDMIGDANLNIHWEKNSNVELREEIWLAADALGHTEFIQGEKYRMIDDHIPFIRAGIPAVDIIDFDYPYWHTRNDTSEYCSAASLLAVGQTVEKWLIEKTGSSVTPSSTTPSDDNNTPLIIFDGAIILLIITLGKKKRILNL